MKKNLLLLILSFTCTYAWAQIPERPLLDTAKQKPATPGGIKDFYSRKDSVKKFYGKDIRFANANQFDQDTIAFSHIDSTLTGFQNYSPFYRNHNYYMNNGNLGLANRNLFPQFGTNPMGFNNGQTGFSLYEVKPDHVQYYRVYAPYTELYWVSAFGQESIFYFTHTQNIKPNLNVGLKYYTVGSGGSYPNQRPKDSYLTGWAWYQSKNLKYNLVSNITTLSFKAQENGGLPNDSIFTVPSVVQHEYEDIYLNDAKNTWKNFNWFLKQTFIIGKRDTNARYQNKLFKSPYSRVSHELLYDQKSYTYQQTYVPGNPPDNPGDPLTPNQYYRYNYYDTLQTNDQIKQQLLRNDVDLALFGRGSLNKFNIGAGIRFDYLTYKQSIVFQDTLSVIPIDRSFNNFILKGRIGFALSNTIGFAANGEYNLAGYNFNDYLLQAIARIDLGRKVGVVQLKALSQNSEPEYLFTQYSSNHHRWDNDLSKINTNQLGIYYSNDRTRTLVSGEYFLVTNYTYLINDPLNGINPTQAPSSVHFFRVKLDQEITFGRFGLSSHFVFQQNNSSFIPTADFYTYQSIFYQNKLFKALGFQLGADVRYYTGYKTYSYAPEMGQYYINSSTREVGNYPILDVFLTANLRRTRFLVRYDYLNQGWNKNGYYTVDKYPMPDAKFKFGISWRFYD